MSNLNIDRVLFTFLFEKKLWRKMFHGAFDYTKNFLIFFANFSELVFN